MTTAALKKFQAVPIVTLQVGPDKIPFHVHQDILFNTSLVFKAAFSGKFKESSERCMSLPEDDPDAVERMMQWLYSGTLDLAPVTTESSDECYWQLARLNTLADKYNIIPLKNRIVDILFELKTKSANAKPPQMAVITYVYNHTTGKSAFRELIVAWYVWHINFEFYTSESTAKVLAYAPLFAVDLAVALGRKIQLPGSRSPFYSDRSIYYEHPAEEANGNTNAEKNEDDNDN